MPHYEAESLKRIMESVTQQRLKKEDEAMGVGPTSALEEAPNPKSIAQPIPPSVPLLKDMPKQNKH